MSILLGRDRDGRRLRRSDLTRQGGRPMSETSDALIMAVAVCPGLNDGDAPSVRWWLAAGGKEIRTVGPAV